jgi:hypothetical protein
MTPSLLLTAIVLAVGVARAAEPPPAPPADKLDFAALDTDRSGTLSVTEVRGTPLAERFGTLDANKDGALDKMEFEAAKDPGKKK